MSEFSDLLSSYIEEKEIKVYNLSAAFANCWHFHIAYDMW